MEEVKKYYDYLNNYKLFNKIVFDSKTNDHVESTEASKEKYGEMLQKLIKEKEEVLKNPNINILDSVIERLADYLVNVILSDNQQKSDYYKSNIKLAIFDLLINNNLSLNKNYTSVNSSDFFPVRNEYSKYSKINRDKSYIHKIDLIDDNRYFISDKDYEYEIGLMINRLERVLATDFFKKRKVLKDNKITCYDSVDLLCNSIEDLYREVLRCTKIEKKGIFFSNKKDNIYYINHTVKEINKFIKRHNFEKFQEFYEERMEEKIDRDTNNLFFDAIYKNIPKFLKLSNKEIKVIFDKFFRIYNYDKENKILMLSNITVTKDLNSILTIYEIIKNSNLDLDYSKINIEELKTLLINLTKVLNTIKHENSIPKRSNGIITNSEIGYVPKRKK